MAVAERQPLAVLILLEAGADPELRTRIDEHQTPLEMAQALGDATVASLLASRGSPLRQRLRSGLTLLAEIPGTGEPVRRQQIYRIRLRLWLKRGEAVRWQTAWGPVGAARLEHDGETLITEVRIDRRSLINGLFYGVEGMHVGGTRRLEIAPHFGYGKRGVPGVIPPDAVLTAEIAILESVREGGSQELS
jgi:FKBP-type peptidyl-prolyl cis-trans isomerase